MTAKEIKKEIKKTIMIEIKKKLFVIIPVLFIFLLLPGESGAQGFLKVDGKRIVNNKGENVLLRGFGLGGWMLQEGYMLRVQKEGQQHRIKARIDTLIGYKNSGEFYMAWLDNHTTKADIDSLKAWGYNSVRLPMHYNLYTFPIEHEPGVGTQTWLAKGFELTDSLLSWCKANQMYLILDLHAAPGGQGKDLNISDGDPSKPFLWESDLNKQKTIALWKKLAARYKDEEWIGGYDIINEPNWGFENHEKDPNGLNEKKNIPLKKLMVDITKAIRSVDKNHIIIIEGNGWGNNYNGILPPWDKNMVLSFHKYWNKNDLPSIRNILEARDRYNVPVWLGETGENSNVWFTEAIHLLESNNIGWAWWPLKKLGHNNPLEVPSIPGYDKVLSYWSGKGPRPDSATAYQGLMELARSTNIKNNILHRDVIDAMIRQPHSNEAIPYDLSRNKVETVIPAVEYDLGKLRVAYFDKDTANYRISGLPGEGNKGRTFRNDGVDIRKDSASDTFYVSDIEGGEWLQYTLDIPEKATYSIVLELASPADSSQVSVEINGNPAGGPLPVPVTGSWYNWKKTRVAAAMMDTGIHRIRIHALVGGFNFKSLEIRKIAKD